MKCSFCKVDINEDAKFCPSCGEKVIRHQKVQEFKSVPMIMKMDEAIEFLRVSRSMFYRLLVEDDPLPFFYVGRDKRFITSELVEWCKRNQTTERREEMKIHAV